MDDEELTRHDITRLTKAARQRWGIPDAVRDAAVTRLAMIIADPKQRPRMHASAIRCLAELDKINIAKEMHDERIEVELDRRLPSNMTVVFEGDPDAGLPETHPMKAAKLAGPDVQGEGEVDKDADGIDDEETFDDEDAA